jgi:fatty acid desaturase
MDLAPGEARQDAEMPRAGARASLRTPPSDYATLKARVLRAGLLERQPRYYALKFGLTLGLLGLSLAGLALIHSFWLQMLNAAFLAFVDTQVGFLAHDIGHRQVFRGRRRNLVAGLIFGNLLLGMSEEWWIDKHNRHHRHPNHAGLDPDIDVPVIAFTAEQALRKRGVPRLIVKHQRFFYLPVTALLGLSPRNLSVRYLLRRKATYPLLEALLLALHFVLYVGALVALLGVARAVAFMILHHALAGVYLGSAFAPNHKGMPVLDAGSTLDFLRRQVLTSRNLVAHPLTDFWYGGLNYQIEHHLFPGMPRNRLRAAQRLVKAFCAERGIPYHETSVLQSYREILGELHRVSAPLRAGRAPGTSPRVG